MTERQSTRACLFIRNDLSYQEDYIEHEFCTSAAVKIFNGLKLCMFEGELH